MLAVRQLQLKIFYVSYTGIWVSEKQERSNTSLKSDTLKDYSTRVFGLITVIQRMSAFSSHASFVLLFVH